LSDKIDDAFLFVLLALSLLVSRRWIKAMSLLLYRLLAVISLRIPWEVAAQVSFEQGISATKVSSESVRRALKRLKTNWKRAKHWITSPDPQYLKKKRHEIA
jgi:hypothetical protein